MIRQALTPRPQPATGLTPESLEQLAATVTTDVEMPGIGRCPACRRRDLNPSTVSLLHRRSC